MPRRDRYRGWKPGRGGHPTRLTPAVHREILKHLRAGSFRNHAAQAAGVAIASVDEWLARGREDNPVEPYASFARDVDQAQGEFVTRSTALISKAGTKDWKARAWLLEKLYPKKFGSRMAHQIEPGEGIRVELIASIQKAYGIPAGVTPPVLGAAASAAASATAEPATPVAPQPEPEQE